MPAGVLTLIRPDVAAAGTVVAMEVVVAVVIAEYVTLNFDLLFAAAGSKFVPVIVTGAPVTLIVGVKSVMVGSPDPPTMNGVLLEALPVGVVIAIGPVAAPTGPLLGVNSIIDTVEELYRDIVSRLPTAS